jgi:hypothetical protein
MKWNKLYHYPPTTRSTTDGLRTYDVGKEKLPSVTTILGATKSQESHLEQHILGQGHLDLTEEGKTAKGMADTIIEKGLGDLSEIWGSEVVLYYPGLYAGATDVVGVYDYEDSIVDFKQSNKPKRKEWINDYFMQLGAYAMAHNYVHRTEITQGVILMCTPDNYFQKFQVKGKEFIKYQHQFLERVNQYYEQKNS